MMYLGDFPADQAVYFIWSTNDEDGASITRATDGAISVYKDNSDGSSYNETQVTTGVTNDEDFDSLIGIHECCITTTDAWYETGHDYTVVLSAATIDEQTVNGVLAHFSIENRFNQTVVPDAAGVAPTTAEITSHIDANSTRLDVDVSSRGTSTVTTAQVNAECDQALSDYGANTVVPDAAGVAATQAEVATECNTVTVTSMAANVMTASALATDAVTEIQSGLSTVTEAQVNAQCDAAIETYRLDELMETALQSQPVEGSLFGDLTEDDDGDQRFSEDALEQTPSSSGGDATEAKQNTIIANLTTVDNEIAAMQGNVTSILEDTNELQTSQGDWATATGFSTHSAADVVDNFETQSQADPTGFHVNVIEIGGTAQTANDNGADINAILVDTNSLNDTKIPDTISLAAINAEVDSALNTALPGTPTAGSINDYIKRVKFMICNKWTINETTGASDIHDDSDVLFSTKAGAFASLAGVTTREKVI